MHLFLRKARTSYHLTIPKDLVEILDIAETPLKLSLEKKGSQFTLTLTPAEPKAKRSLASV
mgnify:CR=1 FL=1